MDSASSISKSLKAHLSAKNIRKITAAGSGHGGATDSCHEELPILSDHRRSITALDHRPSEFILKVVDTSMSSSTDPTTTTTPSNDASINWREPINGKYEFWKNELGEDRHHHDPENQNGSIDQGGDPPNLNLIGQFLFQQKLPAGQMTSFNVDLEKMSDDTASSKELKVSFHGDDNSDNLLRSGRYRDSVQDSNDAGNNSDQVLRCSSNAAFQRDEISFRRKPTNLLRAKTNKSRLMDPPPEDDRQSGKDNIKKSGQMRSGLLGKPDDDDDDPFFDDDLPDKYKKTKFSALILIEWLSLILIIGALICTLSIPELRTKSQWKLKLWKWEVLILALICGRLVSGWGIRVIVFFIERNFLLRKRVLYFVYGIRNAVQRCLWLGLVLLTWTLLFDEKVERATNSNMLKNVTKILVCLLLGTLVWLLKTLMVKVLASSFHVSTYFDRIRESLFYQYVIETLSGSPLIEIQKIEQEEERLADEIRKLQNAAGANIPPDLKAAAFGTGSRKSGRVIGNVNGGLSKSSQLGKSSRYSGNLPKKGDNHGTITVDHLHRLSHKNVSAWNMKRLINIVRHGSLSTLDEQIQGFGYEDESATQIKSELEAKAASKKIFQNVARHGFRYIFMEDLMRFLQEDEALKTMSLFEGASESHRISKSSLKNWVVNAFRERRALALTLNDTKTAVNKLNRIVSAVVAIAIGVIWLLILGIATTKFLLFVSSQLVLVAFIFGNTCKTIFESIIFLFVIHPYDVGDRCEIDGAEMVVEEMNILTTIFLRGDNSRILYPNSLLSTKAINNFYRSPDMGDAVEFCVHISTPAEKIATMRQRILSYIENKKEHWYASPMVIFKDIEDLNKVRMAVWVQHRMNYQDVGERWIRRAVLVEEMVKIFRELDLQYRLLPVDVNVCTLPPSRPSTEPLPPIN